MRIFGKLFAQTRARSKFVWKTQVEYSRVNSTTYRLWLNEISKKIII